MTEDLIEDLLRWFAVAFLVVAWLLSGRPVFFWIAVATLAIGAVRKLILPALARARYRRNS
jgi:hypothetical protein